MQRFTVLGISIFILSLTSGAAFAREKRNGSYSSGYNFEEQKHQAFQLPDDAHYKFLKVGERRLISENYTGLPASYILERASKSLYRIGLALSYQGYDLKEHSDGTFSEFALSNDDLGPQMRQNVADCFTLVNSRNITGLHREKLEIFLIDDNYTGEKPAQKEIRVWRDRDTYLKSRLQKNLTQSALADAGNYPLHSSCDTILHEALHLTGLVDEYESMPKNSPTTTSSQAVAEANLDMGFDCRVKRGRIPTLMNGADVISVPWKSIKHSTLASDSWDCSCSPATTNYLQCQQSLNQLLQKINNGGKLLPYEPACPEGATTSEIHSTISSVQFRDNVSRSDANSIRLNINDISSSTKTVLAPMYVNHLIYPGNRRNRDFYLCALNAYSSAQRTGQCTVEKSELPATCSDFNQTWLYKEYLPKQPAASN